MDTRTGIRSQRASVVALLVGVVHATAIGGVIARLDYPVQTFESVPGGAVGLVAVLAVSTFSSFATVSSFQASPILRVQSGRSLGR
jgi:hypothetical protein